MGLIHWWSFNNTVNDNGSRPKAMIPENSPTFQTGGKTSTYSARYSGGSDHYIYNDIQNCDELSIACWVKLDTSQSTWGQLFSINTWTTNWQGIMMGFDNRPNVAVYFTITDGTNYVGYDMPSNNSLQDGQWHHLAGTYKWDGSKSILRFYVDGVEQNCSPHTVTYKPAFSSARYISTGEDAGEYINGNINDVRIYDHCLSDLDVKNLAKALVLHYNFEDLYKPVKFIESTGTQYIDTGIKASDQITRIEGRIYKTSLMGTAGIFFGLYGGGNDLFYLDYSESGVTYHNTATGYGQYPVLSLTTDLLNIPGYKDIIYTKSGTTFTYSVNEKKASGTSQSVLTTSYNHYLFGYNAQGSFNYGYKCKLYHFKIWVNNKLARDFIPVMRITDGQLGLYDKVTRSFFQNKGTGFFTGDISTYDQLEYIESSGSQYINTGVPSTSTTRLSITFKPSDTYINDRMISGFYNGSNTNTCIYYAYRYTGESSSYNFSYGYTNNFVAYNTNKHTFITRGNSLNWDGTSITLNGSASWSGLNYYICGRNNNGKADCLGAYKLYSVNIDTGSNIPVRQFVPVRRIADSAIGLYDLASDTFFGNSGSGSFIAGPSINNNLGKIIDASGNNHNANLQTSTSFSIAENSRVGQLSIKTVSGDHNARINTTLNPSFISSGTIAFWYKKDSSASSYNSGHFLVATQLGSGSFFGATQNGIPFCSDNCSYQTFYLDGVANANSNVQDTNWHFYVFTGVNLSAWSSFSMHAHGDASWLYRGEIADFKIYNTSLSDSDIKNLYNTKILIDKEGNIYCEKLLESLDTDKIVFTNKGAVHCSGLNTSANATMLASYERIPYIEATGSQQINTGVYFDMNNGELEVDFQSTLTTQNGMIVASNQASNHFWFYYYQAGSGINLYICNSGSQVNAMPTTMLDLEKHTYTYKKRVSYLDNNLLGIDTRTLGTTTYPLYICSWGSNYYFKGKIFRVKISNGNGLIRDFIPVKRKIDGKLGLLDKITGNFFTDTNGGNFSTVNNLESEQTKLALLGAPRLYENMGASVINKTYNI